MYFIFLTAVSSCIATGEHEELINQINSVSLIIKAMLCTSGCVINS